ncbi:AraC family transcriptional regulator [Chromobacterium sphagni]|uniref:AraC family transcriptional regulator n=1 Tax=Chromobacterium sphagni TaxID=1903179 RepID=A0A1S1X3T2_9NEIS|nr:helix-turn-helix transcriptional regulator [Chromobacterium sphagni]OHX14080.1 AraC family transcriptional regulator [Chromobacterium sphagni]OHX20287.1 AraC family transcriptional regulator [Chromobacterium sphagni]
MPRDVVANIDYSDYLGGPVLVAHAGHAGPDSEFRLGTVEYDWHQHARGQLFCVANGLVHVRTRQGSWLLPPGRAGWIPPGVSHKVAIRGAMSGWGVLIAPDACGGLPVSPCVVAIGELLGAVVHRTAAWDDKHSLDEAQQRLAAVLLDELRMARPEPLHLPMPLDERLLRIARRVIGQPGGAETLEVLASHAGLSGRSARRLFAAETGMSFVQWRQQAQLSHALELLAGGDSVAAVSDALGYAAPSNFIAMFRRILGDSPASYFAKRRQPGEA